MQFEEPNTEYLGRAIASLRAAKGMKRMDLKQASGLSYPYIAEIENGSKKSPSLKALAAIAASLGVSPAELHARAEKLRSTDSERAVGMDEAAVRPKTLGLTDQAPQDRLAMGETPLLEEDVMDRIAARAYEAVAPQIRELVAREVRYAVRVELLQLKEHR